MVEMGVAGIALDAASRSPIVLLRDPSGRRQVPIWIDQSQAQNILAGLHNERPPRPLSHDLMVRLLEAGGLRLEKVIIHAIEDSTFRAVLKLQRGEETPIEIDSRPSDAIALALRTGSAIWMLEEVVADASIPVDAEADAEDQEDFRRFLDRTSPAELIRHLRRVEDSRGDQAPEPPMGGAEPGPPESDGPGSGGPAAHPADGPDAVGP
jgi:bifunctional DNase/RNase